MAVADPRIPNRDTVARRYLSSVVDPGNVGAQRIPVPVGRSFRYPGFGRDPELGQQPLDIVASSSLTEQPKASSSLYNVYAGGGLPGGESDGNVGQNSPTTGPDADGPDGIGNMDANSVIDVGLAVLGMMPGPIGIAAKAISVGRKAVDMLGPDATPSVAPSPVAQSVTQQTNPTAPQSPGDEGIADGVAGPNNAPGQANGPGGANTGTDGGGPATGGAADAGPGSAAAAANAGGGAVGNDGVGSSDGGSVGDAGSGSAAGSGSDGGGAAGNDGSSSDGGTYHQGGMIPGAEDGMLEDAPITAQEGEFVLRGEAVQELGPDVADMLNRLPELDFNERQNLLGLLSERMMGGGAMDMDRGDTGVGGAMPSNMPGPAALSTMGGMPAPMRPPVPRVPAQQMTPRRALDNVWAA